MQPGETRVYPSMLADKQVPVLNLTESSITSQADLQDAFQSIHLCSHGGEETTEDKNRVITYQTANPQKAKYIHTYVHLRKKDYMVQ